MNTDQIMFNTIAIALTLSMIVGIVIYLLLQYVYQQREQKLFAYINELEERLNYYEWTD